MTNPIDFSADLVQWAEMAGFHVTQASDQQASSDDPRDHPTVLWSNMGEIRYFVTLDVDGWAVVTESQRLSEEQFIFAANTMDIIEMYFYNRLGMSSRSARDLPLLRYPARIEDLAKGYRIGSRKFHQSENLALISPTDSVIAVSGSGKIAGTAELAVLSICLVATIEDVKQSYMSEDGSPLFAPRAPS